MKILRSFGLACLAACSLALAACATTSASGSVLSEESFIRAELGIGAASLALATAEAVGVVTPDQASFARAQLGKAEDLVILARTVFSAGDTTSAQRLLDEARSLATQAQAAAPSVDLTEPIAGPTG